MKYIYLVRHAQSEFNEKGIFQGSLDSDLTPLGYVQARMVGVFFENKGIKRIISSPQRRALKTALTIGDILGMDVEVDERIKEISFGELEGKRFVDLLEEMGDVLRRWLKDPLNNPLPTQEPMEEFSKRISSFLEDISKSKEDSVVVVAHGGTLHALICIATGLGLENMWNIHKDNASVSCLKYEDGKYQLSYLNRICHLNHT